MYASHPCKKSYLYIYIHTDMSRLNVLTKTLYLRQLMKETFYLNRGIVTQKVAGSIPVIYVFNIEPWTIHQTDNWTIDGNLTEN